MIGTGSDEFAFARIHARYGARAGETDWRRIETIREFPGVLRAAGECGLRGWVAGLAAGSPVHEIDAALRANWRTFVTEVVEWLASRWQPAARWCGPLADLALLDHLSHCDAAPRWMLDDAALRDVARADAGDRARALATGALAPLAVGWGTDGAVHAAWLAEWRRRLPPGALRPGSGLDLLARALRTHLAAFRASSGGEGSALRRALAARLSLLLRRVQLDPSAPFVYFALGALDLERLRGELLRRAAFASPAGT